MINLIRDGITTALYKQFSDEYPVYTEDVKQGFEAPCFFVSLVRGTASPLISDRKHHTHLFSVQFISSGEEQNELCNDMLYALYELLEVISVDGGLIRGTNLEGNILDGVVNFTVNYDFNAEKIKPKPDTMSKIKVERILTNE